MEIKVSNNDSPESAAVTRTRADKPRASPFTGTSKVNEGVESSTVGTTAT